MSPTDDEHHPLTLERSYQAPLDLVYEAWTEPRHLLQWFGPREGDVWFTIPAFEMDLRPGGPYRYCMRDPDGVDHWVRGVYREVEPLRRLVFTFAWELPDGELAPETVITVTFRDAGDGRTTVSLHQAPFATEALRDGHGQGWIEVLEHLDLYLSQLD